MTVVPACLGCAANELQSNGSQSSLVDRLRRHAPRGPLVVAHRGDSAVQPENTLPSFESALDAGADIVELDFQETSDGVLLCLHDKTFDRTTDARAVVGKTDVSPRSLTMAEVQKLDAGRWKDPRFAGTRVPSLEDALRLIQDDGVTLIEHKAGDPRKLVELLRRLDVVEEVFVQSFDWAWLETLRELEPRLYLVALGDKTLAPDRLQAIARTGARMVHWNARDLRLEDVETLKKLGYKTCVYTIDDDLSYLGAAMAGIDAITTNRPGDLKKRIADGRVGPASDR